MSADSPTDLAPPATVTFENHTYTPITEGQATILFPNTNEVFYNPVQQFNRDMSVAAIRTWSKHYFQEQQVRETKKRQRRQASQPTELTTDAELTTGFTAPADFTILEALSATGLRSIRYAKEIPQVRSIVANDLEPDAVASIRRNLAYNDLDETLVRPNCDDACALMYRHRSDPRQSFHVVDLDPYGSASPFLDAAVQSVSSDGGLLCITCTDLAVLAGTNYPEVCFAKYGGTPVKADYCHEMALRLLLNAIQASAVRYRRYIVPMISCSIDFYIRIFVRVHSGAAQVKKALCQTGLVYTCTGCRSYFTDPIGRATTTGSHTKYGIGTGPSVDSHCQFCGHRSQLGGPAWLGPLHHQPFVNDMYQLIRESENKFATKARMMGMVKVISEELDTPFFHTLSNLGKTIHCTIPPLISVCSALLHAGYRVSGSHTQPGSIKTDAPNHVVWDIMRCWVKLHPIKLEKYGEDSPAVKILSQPPGLEASFEKHPKANPESRRIKLVRYQENPTKNWGPKARHKKMVVKRKIDDDATNSNAAQKVKTA